MIREGRLYLFKTSYRRFRTKWTFVALTFAIFLCFLSSAEAGMVYGRVYYSESVPVAKSVPVGKKTFTLVNEKNQRFKLKTDENGNYTVIIPEGVYNVIEDGGQQDRDTGVKVYSYPNPSHQDIKIKR